MKEKELNAELTLLLEELEGYLTASLYERVKRALNALPDPQPEATPIGVEGLPNGMIIKEFEMIILSPTNNSNSMIQTFP